MLVMSTTFVSATDIIVDVEDAASVSIDNFAVSESDKEVLYWIRVVNTGEILIRNLNLTDRTPGNLNYTDSRYLLSYDKPIFKKFEIDPIVKPGEITWQLGDMQTGEEKWVTLALKKESGYIKSNFLNNEVLANGEALGVPIISISEKSKPSKEYIASQNMSFPITAAMDVISLYDKSEKDFNADYVLAVKNTGRKSLEKAILHIALPGEISFVSSYPPPIETPDSSDKEQNIFWTMGDLSPGKEYRIVMTVDAKNKSKMQDLGKARVRTYAWADDILIFDGPKLSRAI